MNCEYHILIIQYKKSECLLKHLMRKDDMLKIVRDLPFDSERVVFEKNNTQVYLYRPSKLSKRFSDYDVSRNFQIWLREGERRFRPNHLRVFIDLNLRVRSRPDLKRALLQSFDNIYYGNDPEIELQKLAEQEFEHFLNDIFIIGVLSQLFIIEQEYCYHRESKYEPPTLFYQGWVRQFIDSPKEIDNLCMSVANRQTPLKKYTNRENKKHKKYEKDLPVLWYID